MSEHYYCTLTQDRRPIKAIHWDDAEGNCHIVGKTCSKIEAYDEIWGEMGYVPMLAVYKDEEILLRVPATKVSVSYFMAQDKEAKGE